MLAGRSTRIAAFDVFDTVLTRALGAPEAVFLAVGRRAALAGLIECTPEAFARARIAAERRAYQNAGGECDLSAIFAELSTALRLSPSTSTRLSQLEMQVEAALLRPVPSAQARVESARAAGQRVVFVSDIYLPLNFVRTQLERHGLWRDGDGCYVSCETPGRAATRTKRSGGLFTYLLANERVAAREVVHHGNSYEHDLRPARERGLGTEYVGEANLNGFETLLERHRWGTEGLSSAMAAASRLARVSTPAASSRDRLVRDVAAGVAAPTLVAYVLWVLRRSQQLGLKRLYFLSRDGQVLLDVASRLARRLSVDYELRYLFGSRQSWNLASLRSAGEDDLAWVWDSTDFLSVESLLARVGLRPPEVAAHLTTIGLDVGQWRRALSAPERDRLRALFQQAEVRACIEQRAAEKRRLVLRYLAQEQVLTSGAWGVVDLGWYGSMQKALAALVSSAGGSIPVGFYFGLFQGPIVDTCALSREAFYFDERSATGYLRAVPDIIPLMEMLCAGDHGTVVDFVERDGAVEPMLKEPINHRVVDWGLPLVRRTIAAFVDNLVVDAALVNPWADVRDPITDGLRAFWVRPSAAIARAWADFPWEDGLGRESYWITLARGYRWPEVARAVWRRRVDPHHRAAWLAGSLMVSPRGIRFALARVIQLRRVWRSLRAR
jgi:FMN phosphatase YigB (HAD superfamily)